MAELTRDRAARLKVVHRLRVWAAGGIEGEVLTGNCETPLKLRLLDIHSWRREYLEVPEPLPLSTPALKGTSARGCKLSLLNCGAIALPTTLSTYLDSVEKAWIVSIKF
jgi:hypothetical protein